MTTSSTVGRGGMKRAAWQGGVRGEASKAAARVPGWTIVHPSRSTRTDVRPWLRVYQRAWTNRADAEAELAGLVRPYPPGHPWRLALRVAWWDGAEVTEAGARPHLRLVRSLP